MTARVPEALATEVPETLELPPVTDGRSLVQRAIAAEEAYISLAKQYNILLRWFRNVS